MKKPTFIEVVESEGTGEIMVAVEELKDTPTVQMVRGDVTAAVAPQDVDGFKSAGYSVLN